MWLRKLKTKTRNQPETPVVSSPTFSVSSFKDIQSLYEEEDNNNTTTTTTTTNNNNSISSSNRNNKVPKLKFSNVFHRVRSATSLLRAFSNQKKGEGNVQEPVQTLQSLLHVRGKAKGVVSEKGGLEKKQFLIEEKTSIGEGGVQESIKDEGVVLEKGDLEKNGKDKGVVSEQVGLEKNQFLIEEKTSIVEVGVQESIKDKGVVLEKGDLEKKQFLIEEPTSIEKVDDNVQELIETSKSLHHGDKDDGVVLEKVNLEKNQVLIEEPSSVGEVADVKVDDNVQESIETLKSLHHGDKDDGVVLEKVDLEKNQVLVEEPCSVGEVAAVKVDDNAQESVGTLKSLHHHLDKDDGVVLEKRDLEKNQVLVEEPSSIGEVGDVNVDVNVDDKVARIELPGTETRVVIFFTSLRVVRSTFEDCKYARTILHSFPVSIDERDLFMDGRFMNELQRITGIDEKTNLTLPRVFIGGRYIGGAEEIRRLHEAGELKKYLEGLAPAPGGTCETCGGHGFILCVECDGSHKCYEDKGGFKPCSGCNENGLVRCPSCSSAPL